VSVINAATNTVTATIPDNAGPDAVAVDPAAGTVYVANRFSGTVSVIDEATNTVTANIPVDTAVDTYPGGVAVDPSAGTVYVTNSNNTVSMIDEATNTLTTTIDGGGGGGVAVDPSTHTAYVAEGSIVSVINPEQAPAITSADSASTGMRSPVDLTVTTTGAPAPALTETGALPAGITFTDNRNGTATLSGTAPVGTAGGYPITITAANGFGSPATQTFTLNVTTAASAPAVTSDPAATEMFGEVFGFTVTTDGYPLPRISKTGTLPPGVYLADNGDGTATISGTPDKSALGPYTITLTAGNKAGKVTQSFTLSVSKAPVLAKITATTATIGTPMDLAITATGYPAPILYESGTLPSGLSFTNTGNGQAAITGTPAKDTAGSRAITINAGNQFGGASQTFILTVRRP
jgi:YVTN family beta-propeller protein